MYVYIPIDNNMCDLYSRAETNPGRKLLIIRRFLLGKLFKGGNYSRVETIRGNTVTGKKLTNKKDSLFEKKVKIRNVKKCSEQLSTLEKTTDFLIL